RLFLSFTIIIAQLYVWNNSLCASQVTLSERSIPLNNDLPFVESKCDATYAPSTCCQILYASQLSTILLKTSTAPVFVVPAVEITRAGIYPFFTSFSSVSFKCETFIVKSLLWSMIRIFSVGNPATCNALRPEWCV